MYFHMQLGSSNSLQCSPQHPACITKQVLSVKCANLEVLGWVGRKNVKDGITN